MESAVAEEKKRRRKDKILKSLINQLPAGSFQMNPYFPNLLNQPDLLVAPEPGRIVAVFLYGRGHRPTWRSALAALEDLFEVKLQVGQSTTTMAVDLSESADDFYHEDMRRLLRNTFDIFVPLDILGLKVVGRPFWARVRRDGPRQELLPLWSMERESVQGSLRRYNEDQYRSLIDKDRVPKMPKSLALQQIAREVEKVTGSSPEREPLVESVKESLGSLSGKYKLGFDLMTRSPIRMPIQIVRLGQRGSRDTLRYLMTKARLMRYSGEGGRLERLWQVVRPLLVVEGNLAGPDHDPFRYVRSLISVGWELTTLDAINNLARLIDDANF
jgi:hypothetical protein